MTRRRAMTSKILCLFRMTQAQIMAEYLALEAATRAHGLLLPEDVTTCMDATARRLGVPLDSVRDAVRSYSAGLQG